MITRQNKKLATSAEKNQQAAVWGTKQTKKTGRDSSERTEDENEPIQLRQRTWQTQKMVK